MRSSEFIIEIESISAQEFPRDTVAQWMPMANVVDKLDSTFDINFIASGEERVFIITDSGNGEIAAMAGFRERLGGRVWQGANAAAYAPYVGKALVARLYKWIKENAKKSIQSDVQQTAAGEKLWRKTLPSLGLKPMIFDTQTNRIIDPATSDVQVYPDRDDPEVHRYTWILEKFDHYPAQNILREGVSYLIPLQNLWATNSTWSD